MSDTPDTPSKTVVIVDDSRTPLQKVGTIVVDATPRATKSVFFAHGGNTTYIFQNGQVGAFFRGAVPFTDAPAFVTDKIGYIAELKEQIKNGAAHFYQDPLYESIEDEVLDPFLAIKQEAAAKAVADYIESQKLKEMGQTESRPSLQGITTTANIASAVAGSASGGDSISAALSSLTTK